jgi:CRP-like cAMP-binding protein
MAREPRTHSFLERLSREQIAQVSAIARRTLFKPGEAILRQRETADRFYLIEEGRVRLDYELTRSRRVQIQEIGPGEALGWSWLTAAKKWQFSATAIDRVTASVFRIDDLLALLERDPRLGYAIMERAAQALLERLQATRHKLRVYIERASGDEATQQVS